VENYIIDSSLVSCFQKAKALICSLNGSRAINVLPILTRLVLRSAELTRDSSLTFKLTLWKWFYQFSNVILGWSTETGLSGNFSGNFFYKFEWFLVKSGTAFSSPWGGRPPLRRGYAAVPPTRRLPRASVSFRYRSNLGIIGALSEHNRAKFGMGQHHQKWGFHKG
jgi:hypothetical protein